MPFLIPVVAIGGMGLAWLHGRMGAPAPAQDATSAIAAQAGVTVDKAKIAMWSIAGLAGLWVVFKVMKAGKEAF